MAMRFASTDPKQMAEELWDRMRMLYRGTTLPRCEVCGVPIWSRKEAYLSWKR